MPANDINPYNTPQSLEFGNSSDAANLPYVAPCACGNKNSVSAAAAGGTISCRQCGKEINVPPLSQLRQMAGKGAYEAGTADTIRRMTNAGELPPGAVCQLSGRPTDTIKTVYVQCERKWKRGSSSKKHILAVLGLHFLPFWFVLACMTGGMMVEEPQVLEYDRIVSVPLRIHEDCFRELKRASQRKLRRILRTVPIYAKLLKEYPHAKIIVKD